MDPLEFYEDLWCDKTVPMVPSTIDRERFNTSAVNISAAAIE